MCVDDKEYDEFVKALDFLIDKIGEDESHPLASLVDVLSALIENYEKANVRELTLN